MADSARVDSLSLLKELRASIIKFGENARMALGEADADIQRTITWLSSEAQPHWQGQVRKCSASLAQAREALRQKTVYRSADGGRPSVVDEKIAVTNAQRRLEHAQAKLKNVERWRRQLEQEILQYRGQVQPIQRTVDDDVPRAVALLDRVMDNLDAYVAVAAPRSAGDTAGIDEAASSMARPAADEVPSDDGNDAATDTTSHDENPEGQP